MEKQMESLANIKEILIQQLVLFGNNEECYKGYEVLDLIKRKHHCDDYAALKIYYGNHKEAKK